MSLLEPGSTRADGVADDAALVAAMVRVELAWYDVFVAQGVASTAQADLVAGAAMRWQPDVEALVAGAEAAGNPVVPFVAALRHQVDDAGAAAQLHRGLTSQDVLDTALMLLARTALVRAGDDLTAMGDRLAALAAEHRATVMAGRTLTQHAVPVTFGLVCAQWLTGCQEALEDVHATSAGLPVQCGGAAGTLALTAEVLPDARAATPALAAALDLVAPALPWHTRRSPVTRVADCLVGVIDSVAPVAAEVALLSRPEIGELSEGRAPGRGGSSTMPHKHNPVLSVLVRAAALQAPSGSNRPVPVPRCTAPPGRRRVGRPSRGWRLARRMAVLGETAPAHGHGHVTDAGTPRRAARARGRDVLPSAPGRRGAPRRARRRGRGRLRR